MKKSEVKIAKSAISGQFPRLVPVPNRVVPVPLMHRQNGTSINQSGTGTTHQNMVGTSTDPSGTGAIASCNLDFWYSYIVELKFEHRGYKNPIKWLTGVQIRMKLREKRTVPCRLGEAKFNVGKSNALC